MSRPVISAYPSPRLLDADDVRFVAHVIDVLRHPFEHIDLVGYLSAAEFELARKDDTMIGRILFEKSFEGGVEWRFEPEGMQR